MNGTPQSQKVSQNPNIQGNLSGFGYQCASKNTSNEVFPRESGGEQQ